MAYGISGISPLGTMGLGTSAFSSYDAYMPYNYGMGYGYDATMYGLGGYGMMSPMMNYPMYMAQMQNQIEASQLIHAGNMHGLMLNNEVQAYKDTDSALFRKILTNGDIQQGVYNLHQKIVEGDQKGVIEEYDKLRSYIFNTYRADLEKEGTNKNVVATVNSHIENVYSRIISAQYNQTRTLKSDLNALGEEAFENGFNQAYKPGHNNVDVDEVVNHIYGTRIDNKHQKDNYRMAGKAVGHLARGGKMAAIGAGVGAGATLTGALLLKGGASLIGKAKSIEVLSKTTGNIGKWAAAICAVGAVVGDIIWRNQDAA